MKGIILHTRRLIVNKKSVTHLLFMFELIFFFRILRSWKPRFSHRSISPHEVSTKEFQVLGGSNRVRNWNKVKNKIYLMSKLLLCQLEIPIFINQLMCQSSLITSVSFVFCVFNRLARWNKRKTIILVRSSFQIPK